MRYGYARTSTKRQKLESQIEVLKEKKCGVIVKEQYTGKGDSEDRILWASLKEKVRYGDTIVFYSINRMSRDSDAGYRDYMEFVVKGIELEFVMEPHLNTMKFKKDLKTASSISGVKIDSGAESTNKLLNSVLGAFEEFLKDQTHDNIKLAFKQSQKEVEDIVRKVKNGLANTTKRGGRRAGYKSKLKKEIPKDFLKKLNSGMSKTDLAKVYSVGRTTIYTWINEMKINEEREPLSRYIKANLKGEELKKALKALDLATSEACIEELVNKYGVTRELF